MNCLFSVGSILHYAERSLLRTPGFTTAAVCTLAIVIGVNVAAVQRLR